MGRIGFLCGNSLLLNIDDEVVSLKFSNNKITDVDVVNKYDQFTSQCNEVEADIELLYTAKYFPRTYYSIYRVVLQLQSPKKLYLLEQYNGTTGLAMYYVCRSFKLCLKKLTGLKKTKK